MVARRGFLALRREASLKGAAHGRGHSAGHGFLALRREASLKVACPHRIPARHPLFPRASARGLIEGDSHRLIHGIST